jgi:hypothetical protein
MTQSKLPQHACALLIDDALKDGDDVTVVVSRLLARSSTPGEP